MTVLTDWLLGFIPKQGIVYDVGSNVGDTVMELAPCAERVFAFEPNPYCYAELIKNVRSCGNVTCLPVGLSDTVTIREVFVYQLWTLLPVTPVDTRYQDRRFCPEHRNDLKGDFSALFLTLDLVRAIRVLPAPTLIKIDVDGMEGRVIQGGLHVLQNDRPLLYLEVSPGIMAELGDSAEGLLSEIEGRCRYRLVLDAGSVPIVLDRRGILDSICGPLAGANILCVPEERWESAAPAINRLSA